jgi:NTE family protein
MKNTYLDYDNQFNKNINSLKSFIGIGVNYEYNSLKPTVDPDYNENVYSLKSYYFNNIEVYAHFVYNTLNQLFNPTDGTYLKANVGRSVLHDVNLNYADNILPEVNGSTNGFTKFNLNVEKRWPFNEKITGIVGANANFIFEDMLTSNEVSFTEYGFGAKYFIGGILPSHKKNNYTFPGLYEDELNASQFMDLELGIQFNPTKNLFLTPHFNIASVGFGDFDDYINNAFSPNGNWQYLIETSTLMSAGTTITYHSFLGPINFDVSWVNDINKVRVFFSVGLKF